MVILSEPKNVPFSLRLEVWRFLTDFYDFCASRNRNVSLLKATCNFHIKWINFGVFQFLSKLFITLGAESCLHFYVFFIKIYYHNSTYFQSRRRPPRTPRPSGPHWSKRTQSHDVTAPLEWKALYVGIKERSQKKGLGGGAKNGARKLRVMFTNRQKIEEKFLSFVGALSKK